MKSYFFESFKISKGHLKVLFLDAAFFVVLILIILIYLISLRVNMDTLKSIDESAQRIDAIMQGLATLNSKSSEDVSLIVSSIKKFAFMFILTTIFALILIVGFAAYFKVKGWSLLLKKKFEKNVYITYARLIVAWNLSWVLLFLLITFGFKFSIAIKQILVLIELVAYIYFSLILSAIFFHELGIIAALKRTMFIGATKLYILIIPFAIIIVLFSLLSGLIAIATMFKLFILAPIITLLYLTWMKLYISLLIKKIYDAKNEN